MLKKILLLSCIAIFAIGCGGNNTTPEQVSKIDSFISLLETHGNVEKATLLKTASETKSGTFYVIELVAPVVAGEYYNKETAAYDLSLYEVGDSIGDYYKKFDLKYSKNSLNGGYDFYVRTMEERDLRDLDRENTTIIGGRPEVGEMYYRLEHYNYGNYVESEYVIYTLEETAPSSKDLEKMGALREEFNKEKISEALVSEFGLSEERGLEISKMVQSWKKISNKRSMTAADVNLFSNQILGTDLSEAEEAYKKHIEGSSKSYDALINKASEVNNTSPEHMLDLVEELLIN